MSVTDHLLYLASEIDSLKDRFQDSNSGNFLCGQDQSAFRGLTLRARNALNTHLGYSSVFAVEMAGIPLDEGYFGGPSYVTVMNASAILRAAAADFDIKPILEPLNAVTLLKQPYVSLSRIAELRSVRNPKFDTARLVRLCEELNVAYEHECHLAVAALVRTIMNHVPSVFGAKNFDVFANNHAQGSLRKSMLNLQDGLKNIADKHLHVQMRAKEDLPHEPQVRFYQDLDGLLAELYRVLAHPEDTDPNSQPTSCSNGGR